MNIYTYNVTGDYKDWCEVKKNDLLIYSGSLFRIIDDNKIELFLNYGSGDYYPYKIRMKENLFLAIPKEPDFLNADYKYTPIIFTDEEFKELLDISYIDKEFYKRIPSATNQDIITMWLCSYHREDSYTNLTEMKKTILNNIIAFSNGEEIFDKVTEIINKPNLSIINNTESFELITAYIEIENKISEWECLIRLHNEYFIKLDEYYIV